MDERNRKEKCLDTKRAVFKYVKNYHRNKENRLVLEGSTYNVMVDIVRRQQLAPLYWSALCNTEVPKIERSKFEVVSSLSRKVCEGAQRWEDQMEMWRKGLLGKG